ncbi:hypothetical protein [Legionella nagasakiensis]|uniref:hypothetical protein n=1 Tax=Legionella nagasakiensis TaxID=535290 RepID=UPI0010551C5C|nr:hypothetical protein [Legionella nagasakiensis]
MSIILIYSAGIVLWPIIWFFLDGYSLLLKNKWIILPFMLCIVVLISNIALQFVGHPVFSIQLEEELFRFLDFRSANIISIISGILVISAVIYGVSKRKIPRLFIRFVALTFITLLGFMIPIIWIPTNKPEWLQVLRAYQTVPFTYGIFFSTTAILILLEDIMKWLGKNK